MDKKWKKISRKQLFNHLRIKIYEDEVELPSGHRTSYIHFGKGKNSAMVIAQRDDKKILIQKEYSYPIDRWLYQLPGGAIEDKEKPVDGAARELREEAGIQGDLKEIGWFYNNNRRSASIMHVFVATNLVTTATNHDIEEAFEDHWISEDQIDHMIQSGMIINYTLLAAWSLYKNRST